MKNFKISIIQYLVKTFRPSSNYLKVSFILLIIGVASWSIEAQTNLALHKKASQSSTYKSPFEAGLPRAAVDGNADGRWTSKSVSHTDGNGTKNPWWTVDLGKVYDISEIQIWNRTDCCKNRLNNMKILVKNTPRNDSWRRYTPSNHKYREGERYPLSFKRNAKARYVMIQLETPNGILSLAEVKVLGEKTSRIVTESSSVRSTAGQGNLALHKNASQSSNYTSILGLPNAAVDGNTDGRWTSKSVTHTNGNGTKNPWWTVDLGQVYDISEVQIWNRTDCCKNRLNNMKILIKNTPRSDSWRRYVPSNHKYRQGERYPLSFKGNAKARYVMIQLENPRGILSLAEVKVLGKKPRQGNQPSRIVAEPDAILTNNTIPVCWETSGWTEEKKWVKDAIEESWEAFANLNFTGWTTCANTSNGIRIKIDDNALNSPHVEEFGKKLNGVQSGMVLNFTFKNWGAGYLKNRKISIESIAMHEFGHALGFQHEQDRSDVDCGCEWAEKTGSVGGIVYTKCDMNSVMNYCAKGVNNATLSKLDVKGVQAIYGASTSIQGSKGNATFRVKNEGLTQVAFEVTHNTHGNEAKTEKKTLLFNQTHDFTFDEGSIIEVSAKYLDAGTWKKSFKEELFSFEGADDMICIRVTGGEAWRCDGASKEKLKSSSFLKAFYSRATSVKKPGCGNVYQGSFVDPIDGGTCWTCPVNASRTIFSVKSDKACEVGAQNAYAKAKSHGKGTGIFGTDCGSGQFWDPNGNCYSCPSGYSRTTFPVTAYNACVKTSPSKFVRATKRGDSGCPPNSFWDAAYGGECWTCPEGYSRTTKPINSAKACVKESWK